LRMRVDIRFNSFFTVVSRVLKRQCKSGDSCTTQTDQRVMAHYKDGGGRDSRKRSRDDYDDAPRHKRGRYFDQGSSESESTEQKLESLITRVGEKGNKTLQSNLQALADVLHTEIGSSSSVKDKVLRTICFCVTSLTEKITVYSTLVAILNARQYNFGEELLEVLMEDLRNALALQDMEKARILVR
jgi:nuclear cap-binding protein subunit 1